MKTDNASAGLAPASGSRVEFLKWECPVCKEVCEDPNDFRATCCHSNHNVRLGHDRGNGWQDAYPANH